MAPEIEWRLPGEAGAAPQPLGGGTIGGTATRADQPQMRGGG